MHLNTKKTKTKLVLRVYHTLGTVTLYPPNVGINNRTKKHTEKKEFVQSRQANSSNHGNGIHYIYHRLDCQMKHRDIVNDAETLGSQVHDVSSYSCYTRQSRYVHAPGSSSAGGVFSSSLSLPVSRCCCTRPGLCRLDVTEPERVQFSCAVGDTTSVTESQTLLEIA